MRASCPGRPRRREHGPDARIHAPSRLVEQALRRIEQATRTLRLLRAARRDRPRARIRSPRPAWAARRRAASNSPRPREPMNVPAPRVASVAENVGLDSSRPGVAGEHRAHRPADGHSMSRNTARGSTRRRSIACGHAGSAPSRTWRKRTSPSRHARRVAFSPGTPARSAPRFVDVLTSQYCARQESAGRPAPPGLRPAEGDTDAGDSRRRALRRANHVDRLHRARAP
jgi:hypothetical protein